MVMDLQYLDFVCDEMLLTKYRSSLLSLFIAL